MSRISRSSLSEVNPLAKSYTTLALALTMFWRRLRLGGSKSTLSDPKNPRKVVLPLALTWCLTFSTYVLFLLPMASLEGYEYRNQPKPFTEGT